MRFAYRLLLAAGTGPLIWAGSAWAQSPADTYSRCLTDAAMQASYGNTPDEDIYRLARNACAGARATAMAGSASQTAAVDTADADKAKNFPAWIKGVRERRRHEQAQRGGQ